jgi:hypothetical protein
VKVRTYGVVIKNKRVVWIVDRTGVRGLVFVLVRAV